MKASPRPAACLAVLALALLAGAAGPAPASPPDEITRAAEGPTAEPAPRSWWTPGRATYVGVPVGGILVIAAGLIVILRRELARRTNDLRHQLARELELEAAYKDLIENAHDVVFTLDRQGQITSFNRAGERVTGFARGEVIGRPLSDLYDPAADHAKLSRGRTGRGTFEMAVRYREGRSAVWEVSARPARRNGVLAVTVCIARDVTERKRAHEELRRLCLIRDQQFENSPLAFIEWDDRLRVSAGGPSRPNACSAGRRPRPPARRRTSWASSTRPTCRGSRRRSTN